MVCRWLYPLSPDMNVLPAPQPLGSESPVGAGGAATNYLFLSGCRCAFSLQTFRHLAYLALIWRLSHIAFLQL
jgi:hypothetical protein